MYAFPYLSRLISNEMFGKLIAQMPPPLNASPESRRDRDIVAMCMLKQMGPIRTVEEASLAITIVAADAHAHDALRGAAENAGNLAVVMQCRAQANAMMRMRHKAAAAMEALMRCRPPEMQDDAQTPEVEAQASTAPPVSEEQTPEPVTSPQPVPPRTPTVQAAPPVVVRTRASTPIVNGHALDGHALDGRVTELVPVSPSGPVINPPRVERQVLSRAA